MDDRESSSELVIPFGKYCGKKIEELPSSYLKWMMNHMNGNEDLVEAAFDEYEYRSRWGKHGKHDFC